MNIANVKDETLLAFYENVRRHVAAGSDKAPVQRYGRQQLRALSSPKPIETRAYALGERSAVKATTSQNVPSGCPNCLTAVAKTFSLREIIAVSQSLSQMSQTGDHLEGNKGVWIQTFDSAGKPSDRSFHLIVLTH